MTPVIALAAEGEKARKIDYQDYPAAPEQQTQQNADQKSMGCVSCHTASDAATMHSSPAVVLGCTDCHGGSADVSIPSGPYTDEVYAAARDRAHVLPLYPESWHYPSSANPERSYTLLNSESTEFVRFVNPADYRAATEACGACHQHIIDASVRSMMATGVMLWGGASYNNGILPFKDYILGEGYTSEGEAAKVTGSGLPPEVASKYGVLPELYPLPTWENVKPGDVFRVFERGGRNILNLFPETGVPNVLGQIQRLEEPGRPDIRQSNRGPGTGARISVPLINIHKTRLNDPFTWFMGTNDRPGDYRTSGCASCHVVYANDRDERHSGQYAAFGRDGESISKDPTIPKGVSGHPLRHQFTVTTEVASKYGVLPELYPLPTWENVKPGDVFRVFERGGRNILNLFPETGVPNVLGQIQRLEEPGRPDIRQSNRGPGTGARISVPLINIHKTRLNDPFTWFMGTNDQPGDYRTSVRLDRQMTARATRDPGRVAGVTLDLVILVREFLVRDVQTPVLCVDITAH